MSQKMEKKLRVGLIYSNVICAIAAILMYAIIPLIIVFPPKELWAKILWISLGSILGMLASLAFILLYQTATLNDKGICFRICIFKVAVVSWVDIKRVEITDLPTLVSTLRRFDAKWIIIHTDYTNQLPKFGGGNFKNKPPWQIKYSKKSVDTIKDYLKKYSNITLDTNKN